MCIGSCHMGPLVPPPKPSCAHELCPPGHTGKVFDCIHQWHIYLTSVSQGQALSSRCYKLEKCKFLQSQNGLFLLLLKSYTHSWGLVNFIWWSNWASAPSPIPSHLDPSTCHGTQMRWWGVQKVKRTLHVLRHATRAKLLIVGAGAGGSGVRAVLLQMFGKKPKFHPLVSF